MGLFSNLRAVKGELDAIRAATGSLGLVDVPGEAKVELPAGTVRLTYQQRKPKWLTGDTNAKKGYATRPQIKVNVEGLEVKQPSAGQALNDDGLQRASLAFLEVEKAGTYLVSTEPMVAYYTETEGLEPKILLDPA